MTVEVARKYESPKRRLWMVQVEFFDGITIDAMSDDDALERWRRVSAWTDETALDPNSDWLDRVLNRARSYWNVELEGLNARSSATEILDALYDAECLILRRKG